MSVGGHRAAPLAVLLAVVLAMCAAGCGCSAGRTGGRSARRHGDLAVVLLAGPNRLVAVDLGAMRVVGQAGLRSLASDLTVDRASGLAVTAQCGGIASDADDAVGVWDARAGGAVDYVRLGCANPGRLVAGGGSAYILHGMERSGGMVGSVVDLRRRRVAREGLLPLGPGIAMGLSGGGLWTFETEPSAMSENATVGPEGAGLYVNVCDVRTFARRRVGRARVGLDNVLIDGERVLLLSGRAGAVPAAISEIDPVSGGVIASLPVAGLDRGAWAGAVAGARIALIEWDGGDGTDEGTHIAVLDRRTLASEGVMEVRGAPCAIAAWRDRIVVVERTTARLLVIDPRTRRVTGSVDLGGGVPIAADVEVLLAD